MYEELIKAHNIQDSEALRVIRLHGVFGLAFFAIYNYFQNRATFTTLVKEALILVILLLDVIKLGFKEACHPTVIFSVSIYHFYSVMANHQELARNI